MMKKINWTVRLRNRTFWAALIPAIILLIQAVAAVFGYTLDFKQLGDKLLAVINALFGVLTIIGVVADPTTIRLSDSRQALTYENPRDSEGE